MLTSKQKELLMFIHERLKETGVPPSFDEMKEALDLKSKSGIHRLITALEERGFVRRLPHRARAMEIVRLPELGAPRARRAQPRLLAERYRRELGSRSSGRRWGKTAAKRQHPGDGTHRRWRAHRGDPDANAYDRGAAGAAQQG